MNEITRALDIDWKARIPVLGGVTGPMEYDILIADIQDRSEKEKKEEKKKEDDVLFTLP